jgi:hypothetical protein
VRIAWEDGDGTHELDQLMEHGLELEDGPNGEPEPKISLEAPAGRAARRAREANRQRQAELAMEKRFVTTHWEVRIQTGILGILGVNAFNGWTRVLGHHGNFKSMMNGLGMGLIARGKRMLREMRNEQGTVVGRPPNYMLSPSTRLSTRAPTSSGCTELDALPRPRDSTLRHIVSPYSVCGKPARYQRRCVICGKDTSYFLCRLRSGVRDSSAAGTHGCNV